MKYFALLFMTVWTLGMLMVFTLVSQAINKAIL
ncbi:hypothetical protein QO009_003041 [Brevibacillus aydinogluensis]|nr:hypothetical protein [Brevibacillus aydinogluensis]